MAPRVSIIILNWNGLDDTVECLDSLKKAAYPNYEVIVVDNASSGNDVATLRARYGDYVHLIANDKNYGFSEGNNIGMRYALERQCDYVLLLNNDTVVDADFLTELVSVAESDHTIGIEGAKVYYYDPPNRLHTVGGKVHWWVGIIRHYGDVQDDGQFDQIAQRGYVYATAMLIKRQVMEQVSLLDSTFFFGIEEYDYCARATRAGFKVVYVPKSRVWHKVGASRKKLPDYPETQKQIQKETGAMLYKHFFKVFRKHSPPPLLPLAFTVACVNYMIIPKVLQALSRSGPRHES
jgi:GT2 family glycosyltransferase